MFYNTNIGIQNDTNYFVVSKKIPIFAHVNQLIN